jgi:glutamate carboxypeptidase
MSKPDPIQYFAAVQNEMVILLQKLVEIESPSGYAEGAERCSRAVTAEMEKLPQTMVRTETIDTPLGPILKFDILPNNLKSGRKILILTHMDTVYPRGSLSAFPFRLSGREAWGPGVFDMKSGIVESMFAVKYLVEHCSSEFKAGITLLCTPDEEIGSPESRLLIEQEARSSFCVLVPEPSLGEGGALKTSRSGKALYHIKVKGVSSHSGLDPLAGVSAVKELASQICDVYSLARPDEGLHINVGVVRGGTAVNVVADYAEAEIDVRLTRTEQMEYVTQAFDSLKPKDPRVSMEVAGGLERPPWQRDAESSWLFDAASHTASQLGIELKQGHAGGSSDGNFTAALNIPTLDGLGPVGNGAHSIGNEKILIDSLAERAALLTGVMLQTGGCTECQK